MVSIYSGNERKLYENRAIRDLSCGAVVLNKSNYNGEIGIDIDGAEMELLIF